jgi:membrane-bound lytic murein transglycosylase MltF
MVMRVSEPFFGDWDAIVERGVLRVLVTYSRTNFFLSEGRLRGFEYEMFNELEQELAKRPSTGHPPLKLAYFPVPFDELLDALRDGHGDVAAASLAVTEERERIVTFTEPYQRNVDQVFVAHAGLPPIESWDDLGGCSVHVVAGTSFCAQLEQLSEGLVAVGIEPLVIEKAARGLHTEDLLELVHSGAFDYTVADRFMVDLWSEVLDGIRIESDFLLGTGANSRGPCATRIPTSKPS